MSLSLAGIKAGMDAYDAIYKHDPTQGVARCEIVEAVYTAMNAAMEKQRRAASEKFRKDWHAHDDNWHHESYYIPEICTNSYEFIIDREGV